MGAFGCDIITRNMRHNWAIHENIIGANHIRSHNPAQWLGHRVETKSHLVKTHPHHHPASLQGKNILVTSSDNTAEKLTAMLNQAGAEAVVMPLIEITEPDSWQPLDDAVQELYSYQWLFFASGNAVISFCKRCRIIGDELSTEEICALEKKFPKVAVIGKATAAVAQQYNLPVDYCPETYLAENFVAQFPAYPRLEGQRILWPRTDIGRDFIFDHLQSAGAQINIVPAYKSVLPTNTAELCLTLNELITGRKIDAITLASHQTVVNLSNIIRLILEQNRQHRLLQPSDYKKVVDSDSVSEEELKQIAYFLQDILIVTIGPQTAEGALNYLGKESLQANPHTSEGMVKALIQYYS